MNAIGCDTGNVHLKTLYILHKCFVRIYSISTRISYRRRVRELGSILHTVFLFCCLLEIRKSFSSSLFCHGSRYYVLLSLCVYNYIDYKFWFVFGHRCWHLIISPRRPGAHHWPDCIGGGGRPMCQKNTYFIQCQHSQIKM